MEDLINLKLFTVSVSGEITLVNQMLNSNDYDIGIIEEKLRKIKEDVETAIRIARVFEK